jgi:hypothetical protein
MSNTRLGDGAVIRNVALSAAKALGWRASW